MDIRNTRRVAEALPALIVVEGGKGGIGRHFFWQKNIIAWGRCLTTFCEEHLPARMLSPVTVRRLAVFEYRLDIRVSGLVFFPFFFFQFDQFEAAFCRTVITLTQRCLRPFDARDVTRVASYRWEFRWYSVIWKSQYKININFKILYISKGITFTDITSSICNLIVKLIQMRIYRFLFNDINRLFKEILTKRLNRCYCIQENLLKEREFH